MNSIKLKCVVTLVFFSVLMLASVKITFGQTPKGWNAHSSHPDNYEMGGDPTVTHGDSKGGFIKSKLSEAEGYGTWMAGIEVNEYLGKRVRMSGYVKTEAVEGWAGLWMRVDGPDDSMLSFDNMGNRPIKGTTGWERYEIVLDVPETSIGIFHGLLLVGKGNAWFDGVKLETVGSEVEITRNWIMDPEIDAAFEAKTYKSSKNDSLNYRIYTPEGMDAGRQYPLVLFFHGAGERGDDNYRQLILGVMDILKYSKKSNNPAIILAPQCPNSQSWVSDIRKSLVAVSHTMPEESSLQMKLAVELLKDTMTELPVDKKRVYVTGLSMGGFGTWDILQRMPDIFAAAIPVCGGGDPNLADKIKQVPIWAFHGDKDTVVRPELTSDMIAALKKSGGDPKYTEYKGVGHDSWNRTYANEEVLKWLFLQEK